MSFWNLFRKKKEPVPQPMVQLPDGKMASANLARWLQQLQPYALPCIRISAAPSDELFIFDSKFGGLPYWPANTPYPVDGKDKYMYLLAQLNFSQIPPLDGFPTKGILQFYLADDDVYGLDFGNPTSQTNFRVVYFEDTTATPMDNFGFLEQQQQESSLPVERQMALQFAPGVDYYSYADARFPAEEVVMEEGYTAEYWQALEKEVTELYPDNGHKMGGYAYFTQYDPRDEEVADYRDYILLLQIDSQLPHICWGDVGVGNFFIHPDDLRRKDFSKVLYNWDCT
jgi:uncharacterized protein YwqG